MSVNDYKLWSNRIKATLPTTASYRMYLNLCEIFIQDCAMDLSQKYYGNLTKQKSHILFELQSKFLNSNQLFK